MHVKQKHVALALGAVGAALVAFALAQSPENMLSGPPMEVKVGSTQICVGRQFIDPNDLLQVVTSKRAITGYPYDRVALSLFSPELHGFTAEHYKSGIAKIYDKRQYPSDWVRITIWPGDTTGAMRFQLSSVLSRYYEAESTADSGFKSHRAERQCVGKVAGEGWVQAQAGPECLDYELKYGHPADPNIILLCNRSRCWLRNRLEKQSVWFDYDFPRSFLSEWPAFHTRIKNRIAEWKQDRSCLR